MKVVLIGAGNLATNLGKAFKKAGIEVVQVYSRTKKSAKLLSDILVCNWTIDIQEIVDDADYYIFSVKDKVLEQLIIDVCSHIKTGIFLHTAGSMSCDVFKNKVNKYGVFYPLQTFSKNSYVDFENIPIFIEGNSIEVSQQLEMLAKKISINVYTLTSEVRQYIHLSAVWVCNFVNHCYSIGQDILAQHGIPFKVLLPLIYETTKKVSYLQPKEAQTGPAVRGDKNIIEKHIKLMHDNPQWQELYKNFSQNIYDMSSSKKKHYDKL